VLFELIGARYERRSLPVTANQPFGQWAKSSQTRFSENHAAPANATDFFNSLLGLCQGPVEPGCASLGAVSG
jgi:hypothetical protein